MNAENIWTQNDIKLLLVVRLELEPEFSAGRRKRSVLWNQVLNKIKSENERFSFTRDDITKKFSNLLITYHRIKKRNNKTGRDATLWEYYDMFNEVYGSRHCVEPPTHNVTGTFPDETRNLESSYVGCDESTTADDDQSIDRNSPTAKRKKPNNEILSFLRAEAKEDEARHQKLVALEEERITVEREKIAELRQLKEILQAMLAV